MAAVSNRPNLQTTIARRHSLHRMLGLGVMAMLCIGLSLERLYVVQHALVGAGKKVKDDQRSSTRNEGD